MAVSVIVTYERSPDAERFAQHAELCRRVAGAAFRHGPVFGSPTGEPRFRYVAEFEFPDRAAFDAAARTDEFLATGRDAAAMGIPFTVHFAELA